MPAVVITSSQTVDIPPTWKLEDEMGDHGGVPVV